MQDGLSRQGSLHLDPESSENFISKVPSWLSSIDLPPLDDLIGSMPEVSLHIACGACGACYLTSNHYVLQFKSMSLDPTPANSPRWINA